MSNVIKFRKLDLVAKSKGKTLCNSGFHQWKIVKEKQFEVKSGKLVTVFQCKRCGVSKNQLL